MCEIGSALILCRLCHIEDIEGLLKGRDHDTPSGAGRTAGLGKAMAGAGEDSLARQPHWFVVERLEGRCPAGLAPAVSREEGSPMILTSIRSKLQDDLLESESLGSRMQSSRNSQRRPRQRWRPQFESLEGRQLLSSVVSDAFGMSARALNLESGRGIVAVLKSDAYAVSQRVGQSHWSQHTRRGS